jgi:hypothetical protein
MSIDKRLALDLEDLPMDVFELAENGLTVESLTAGHGMTEIGASCLSGCDCSCPFCGCFFAEDSTHDGDSGDIG